MLKNKVAIEPIKKKRPTLFDVTNMIIVKRMLKKKATLGTMIEAMETDDTQEKTFDLKKIARMAKANAAEQKKTSLYEKISDSHTDDKYPTLRRVLDKK